jgi:carboxyl-terminal processing protease
VLALALKQNIDAKLIGDTTFGKWSIQTIYDFDDGSSIKYTIGRWYAPDNTNIDGSWIVPDNNVNFDSKLYQSGWIDTQLQSAINYFK